MGSDPDSARFVVCLAASAPKRKPSGQPHHAHHAPECFRLRTAVRTTRACGTLPKPCWMESPKRMRQMPDGQLLSTLPMRMGGLGLQSTARCAPAAHWASWADSPQHTRSGPRRVAQTKSGGTHRRMFGRVARCIIRVGPQMVLVETIMARVAQGQAPSEDKDSRSRRVATRLAVASSVLDTSFRKSSMLTGRPPSRQAHLRTHSGLNGGIVFAHAPTTPECTVPPCLFRVLLLERLNLPLPITEAVSNALDAHGRHRATCTRSGRVRKRATPTERPVGS